MQLGQLVALSVTRELGPVVTALLFTGRAGSALTAEIALMKTTEQLASMEMLGVDPLWRVIAPRFWAGFYAMPLLSLIFSVVSHDVPETMSIADYIYVLGEGRIVGEGTPEAIKNHDNPYVKQFIHGLSDGIFPFHYPAPPYEDDLFQGASS